MTKAWLLKRFVPIAVLCLELFSGARASARVEFEVVYLDARGQGFFDDSPRAPAGGNPGKSLGEQRRLAFAEAVAIWAQALDSDVHVVVEASFERREELACDNNSAVLGGARAESVFRDFEGAPRRDLYYPGPLADKLAGVDLDPGQADISALFNPRLDEGECLGGLRWDYGFEPGNSGADFINTVLHELAHGLGFSNLTDEQSGTQIPGFSPFEWLTRDNTLGRHWDEMSAAERANSARNPLGLVWTGFAVNDSASQILAEGTPSLALRGDEDRVLTLVGEVGFGPFAGEVPAAGRLVSWSPREACAGGKSAFGQVVMLRPGAECRDVMGQYTAAQRQGASGVLLRDEYGSSPPWSVDAVPPDAKIPALTLLASDFDQLRDSLSRGAQINAKFQSEDRRLVGADAEGRVYLSANDPILEGSSVTHWDRSVRRRTRASGDPDGLLMEPVAGGLLANEVDDLTVQLLQDIGWLQGECGNALLEAGEVCDEGPRNSDSEPGACRSDCRAARCGDGVVDNNERCDSSLNCARNCGVSTKPDPGDPVGADAGRYIDAAAPSPTLQPDSGARGDQPDAGPGRRPRLSASGGAGCDCKLGASQKKQQPGAAWSLAALVLLGLHRATRRFSRA